MKKSRALDALAALANDTRLDIIRQLVPAGRDGLSAGDIGKTVKLPASRLSFHLAALDNAGLVSSRRESRNIIYTVEYKTLGGVFGYLMNDCCGAHPEICACLSPKTSPAL